MSRVFGAKRGHYIERESVEEALEEVFGDYSEEGDDYVVKDFEAFSRVDVSIVEHSGKKNELEVATESDMEKADRAVQAKRALNEFLEEVTGYDPEARKDKMKREVEDS